MIMTADPRGILWGRNPVKIRWTQFHWLKVRENALYRRRKETAKKPQWQVVVPRTIRSQIFKACHHHAMAAHQRVVRTAALTKRISNGPECRATWRLGAEGVQHADVARLLSVAMVNYNSPAMAHLTSACQSI